jgi:hypothetical protein
LYGICNKCLGADTVAQLEEKADAFLTIATSVNLHPARLLLLVLAAPVTITGLVAVAEIAQHGNQSLVIPDVVDLGEVFSGETAFGSFVIINPTTNSVTVEPIETKCSCTVLEQSPFVLAPGESNRVFIAVNTQGKTGSLETPLLIHHGRKVQKLGVIVSVKSDGFLVAKPSSLYLGDIKAGQRIFKATTVSELTASRVEISITNGIYPKWINVKYERSRDLGKVWRVNAEVNVPPTNGELSAEILLQTDSKHFPSVRIPVFGFVVGNFSSKPREVVSVFSIGQGQHRFDLTLESESGSFRIKKLEMDGLERLNIETYVTESGPKSKRVTFSWESAERTLEKSICEPCGPNTPPICHQENPRRLRTLRLVRSLQARRFRVRPKKVLSQAAWS